VGLGPGLALAGGLGTCALALPESRRPALLAAGLGAAAVGVAVVTGWRLVGTLAVALVAAAPLLAGAIEPAAARPARLVLAAAGLLALVAGLDRLSRPGSAPPVVVLRAPLLHRWGGVVTALAATGLVAAAGVSTAVPSVALVLVGLVTGVAAVVVATRLHREPSVGPGTDVQ
jgi:hypothetical protein